MAEFDPGTSGLLSSVGLNWGPSVLANFLGGLPQRAREAQIQQAKVNALQQLQQVQLVDPTTGQINPAAYAQWAQIMAASGDPRGAADVATLGQEQQDYAAARGVYGRYFGGGGGGAAVPAGGGSYGQAPANKQAIAGIVADEWRKAGAKDSTVAGVLANIGEESAFNPTLRHPDQPRWGGEAHFAHGLYQEGGAEWNRYVGWLNKNYPGADWRDPALQSRFAAWNLKTNYPAVWARMQGGNPVDAASAYTSGYLKPRLDYQTRRILGFRRYGVAPPPAGAETAGGAAPPAQAPAQAEAPRVGAPPVSAAAGERTTPAQAAPAQAAPAQAAPAQAAPAQAAPAQAAPTQAALPPSGGAVTPPAPPPVDLGFTAPFAAAPAIAGAPAGAAPAAARPAAPAAVATMPVPAAQVPVGAIPGAVAALEPTAPPLAPTPAPAGPAPTPGPPGASAAAPSQPPAEQPQLVRPRPLPPGYNRWETAVDDMRRDGDRLLASRSPQAQRMGKVLLAEADAIEQTHTPMQFSANQPIYDPERARRGENPWIMPPMVPGARGSGGVQGMIAQRLMQEHPDWTAEQLQAALNSGRAASRSNIGQVMQRKDEEYAATHNGQRMPAAMYEAESQKYQRSMTAQNRWFSGPLGNTVRSLDVVVSHMGVLDDLTTELQKAGISGNYQLFNKFASNWAEASGNPAPTNFKTAAQIVGTEIMKALTNNNIGTGAEREELAHRFNTAESPQQIRGALNTARKLLAGQLNGLRRQFKTSTLLGDDDFNSLLAPENLDWYQGKDGTLQAPNYRRFGLDRGSDDSAGARPPAGGGSIRHYDSQGKRVQ